MEADALLIEISAHQLTAEWARVQQEIGCETSRACVILIAGASSLACPEPHGMLKRLAAMALAGREAGRPLFAVLVDPEGRLGLPPLYRESGGR